MHSFSVWEQESYLSSKDVVIIGAGFAGLWSALHLKQLHPSASVLILEGGLLPTGASTKNAGFCCFGSPSELLQDAKQMGADRMWELVQLRCAGLQMIKETFHQSEIDYEPTGGYECFSNDAPGWEKCVAELDWLNEGLKAITGETGVFITENHRISHLGLHGFTHLIGNRLEGALNPAKLLMALTRKVQSLGVEILTGVAVTGMDEREHDVVLATKQQLVFRAGQVLLCTNAFTGALVKNIDIVPNRGQVMITGPLKNLLLKGTFHYNEGFYYFRNVGNRLLIGGARNKSFESENTLDLKTTGLIQDELLSFTRRHILPKTDFEITHHWAGIMAMGSSKLPVVKALSKRTFSCVRFSGMGVALAPIASQQVAALMSSRR